MILSDTNLTRVWDILSSLPPDPQFAARHHDANTATQARGGPLQPVTAFWLVPYYAIPHTVPTPSDPERITPLKH